MKFTVVGGRYKVRPGATAAMHYQLVGGPGHGSDGNLQCHMPTIAWSRAGRGQATYVATGQQDPKTGRWLYEVQP